MGSLPVFEFMENSARGAPSRGEFLYKKKGKKKWEKSFMKRPLGALPVCRSFQSGGDGQLSVFLFSVSLFFSYWREMMYVFACLTPFGYSYDSPVR